MSRLIDSRMFSIRNLSTSRTSKDALIPFHHILQHRKGRQVELHIGVNVATKSISSLGHVIVRGPGVAARLAMIKSATDRLQGVLQWGYRILPRSISLERRPLSWPIRNVALSAELCNERARHDDKGA